MSYYSARQPISHIYGNSAASSSRTRNRANLAALNKANLERLERERWSPVSFSSPTTSSLSSLSSLEYNTQRPPRSESFYTMPNMYPARSHASSTHRTRERGRSATPRKRYSPQSPISSPVLPPPPPPSMTLSHAPSVRPFSESSPIPSSRTFSQASSIQATPTQTPPPPIFGPSQTSTQRVQIYRNPGEGFSPPSAMRSRFDSSSHTPVGRPFFKPFVPNGIDPGFDSDSDSDSDISDCSSDVYHGA
ncbi:hypothetical protein BDZ89DRAFT_1063671 [Hymenopellis radicata]|nr:hypothetical protein BDZ89DRAFT_1063671 [Hymenopellis radicata]